ncbi:single-stranded DNA-binding protein [Undibacterium sp.]|uniref:single-stranded DNA-binding protein n=1 Tax=Undibacterium sp. TaxID=1914977 RepID=UPI0037508B7B
MSLDNQFTFHGRLTHDPVVAITPSNKTVTTIEIAVDASYKDAGGKKVEKVNFFRLQAWGDIGENAAKFLTKGATINVCGSINNNFYEKQGMRVYEQDFVIEEIKYRSKKKTD